MRDINTICIDFHGVLTNGRINITADGRTQFECVSTRDIAAIRELIAKGWAVYIVTSSKSPIIDAYCKKVGCEKIQDRLKHNVFPNQQYIAIGDSAFDIEMLKSAAQAYCPADAEDVVKNIEGITWLQTSGGDGCVAELLQLLK